jgi:endonuclease YncB( thermonuclease family)
MKKLLLLSLLLASLICNAQFVKGKCIRVVDGDTYIFVSKKGDTLRVRDAYSNSPEKKNSIVSVYQTFANESTLEATKLLQGKEFSIKINGEDSYGRTIAFAKLPVVGYFHRHMINYGYSWSYKQKGKNYKLQLKAQAAKVGLWAYDNPTNPSVWLKKYNTHK